MSLSELRRRVCRFLLQLLLVPVFAPLALADTLGVLGPVYEITEPDLLEFIQAALERKQRNGELAAMQKESQRRLIDAVNNPVPAEGVSTTVKARTFYFDPSVRFSETIADRQGNIIVPAGTRKNPLEVITLTKRLVFFDARDRRQVLLARALIDRYEGLVKPILVAGSYMELMKAWQEPVYYDQGGKIVRQLGITQVPAVVSQEGLLLRIDELSL